MKRKAIDELIKLKMSDIRKPVLLTGVKGVGKTYLAYDFAKAFFERIFYIHFKQSPLAKELFDIKNPDKSLDLLKKHFNITDDIPASRILIADEISYCVEALKLMQNSGLSQLFDYIICISSNPILDELTDCFTVLPIYPLEFDEFLVATGNEWYIDLICTHFHNDKKLPDIVHKELLDLYHIYIEIGGMPGSINEYLNLSSAVNVAEQHNFLLGAYHDNIIRENSESDAFKMNQVLDSLPHQLMKENKKFQYKLIRKGTTHSMYRDAIQRLANSKYVIRCNRISNEQLITSDNAFELFEQSEISVDTITTNFKLYLFDTGLLNTKIAEEYDHTYHNNKFRALFENNVAQSLQAKHYPFAFWESDSMAKIDFIIQKNNEIIPIEIYTDSKTRSKSISVFKQKCSFPYAIKVSSKNFEQTRCIKYVPYYAVFCI